MTFLNRLFGNQTDNGTAIEHRNGRTHPAVAKRHGIEDRLRANNQDNLFTYLGDHVPDLSLDEHVDELTSRYPVIIPQDFYNNHMWLVGATRSGKTARGLHPIAAQKIRQNTGPVIIGDMKGDDAMFHGLMDVAKEEGRRFVWLTNVPYFSSYLFNPWAQQGLRNISLSQLVQLSLQTWNLWYGFEYGKSFFSAQNRGALLQAFKLVRSSRLDPLGQPLWMESQETQHIVSFDEAYEQVKTLKGHPEYGGAHSLLMVLEDMANIMQLNFSHQGKPLPQTAVDNAIKVSDVLCKGENGKYPVVYFYLRACTEMVGVSQIMKMFIYSSLTELVQARDFYKLGRTDVKPPDEVWVGIDEWQHIADDAIRLLLAQSAGFNMHFCLANQDVSQLRQGKLNLLETVWEGCGNKLFFTARDPDLQDRLIKISGEKTDCIASYDVSHEAYQAGQVDERNAIQILNGAFKGVTIRQARAPRFDRNKLLEMTNHPSHCIYVPPQAAAGINFGGYPIILDCPFHVTEAQFDELNNERPWPEPTEETIVPEVIARAAEEQTNRSPGAKPPAPKKRVLDTKQPTKGETKTKEETDEE